jgi:hypothetical protein
MCARVISFFRDRDGTLTDIYESRYGRDPTRLWELPAEAELLARREAQTREKNPAGRQEEESMTAVTSNTWDEKFGDVPSGSLIELHM